MSRDHLASGWLEQKYSTPANNYKNAGHCLQLLEWKKKYFFFFLFVCSIVNFIAYNKFNRQDLTNHSPPIPILIIYKLSSEL